MTDNESTKATTSFVPDDTQLQLEGDNTALRSRIEVLLRQPLLSNAEQAVVMGIWRLTSTGKLFAKELRELLMRLQGFSTEYDPNDEELMELLSDVCISQWRAWKQLTKLVTGENIENPWRKASSTDRNAEEQLTYERVRDAMDALGRASKIFTPQEVVELLSLNILQAVRSQAAREWLGSPYALGASLLITMANPLEGFYSTDRGRACVVDALSRAVNAAQRDYEEIDAFDGRARVMALGRLDLLWMILKGLVFSALEQTRAGMGRSLPGILVDYPNVIEQVVSALQGGFETLEIALQEEGLTVPAWSSSQDPPAADYSTEELVERLRAQVAHESANIGRRRP